MGLFYELWGLVLSIDFQLDSGHVIGWAIFSSFIFCFWNQSRVSLALCLGSLSFWNVHPSFHHHHPGRWQKIFIKKVLVHFSIHPSHLLTSLLVFWGDMHCPIDLLTWRVFCHPKSLFQSYLTRLYSPQYFTGMSKYCSANFKHTSAFLAVKWISLR